MNWLLRILFTIGIAINILGVLIWLLATEKVDAGWFLGLLEHTAHLGDTFGGLSAPFIGMVSVYLVYRAFRSRICN